MFRRSEVMGIVTKFLTYARRNKRLARDEGREADAEVQHLRVRTLQAVYEALLCLPEFENASALEARRGETGTGSTAEGSDIATAESRDAQ